MAKQKLPYIKYITTYMLSVLLLLVLALGLTFYLKFMFYNPKVSLPESQFELTVDFTKIGRLQAAYFSLKEPERFEPKYEFQIYDTVLMQSVYDKVYDTVVGGNIVKNPDVEVISGETLELQNQKAQLSDLQDRLKEIQREKEMEDAGTID